MKKLDYIDALRGFAILATIIVHANQFGHSDLPVVLNKIVDSGAMGVQLFYIVSAFTLFLSFKSRSVKEIRPVRNFFIRRFFRIAPMFYLGICYYLFQNTYGSWDDLGGPISFSAAEIFSNIIFLHWLNPFWISNLVPGGWSIGIEMTFYLIIPFLFSKIKNINQAFNFFMVALLLKAVLNVIFLKFPLLGDSRIWDQFLFFYFPSQLPVFALGIIMYFILAEGNKITDISGKSMLVFSIILLVQLTSGSNLILQKHILFGMSFVLLSIGLSKYPYYVIVNPVIKYIGKLSFSMYLVQFSVFFWLSKFHSIDYFNNGILNYATRFFIVTSITVLIANIFYKFVELPFQKIGKSIIDKFENMATKHPLADYKQQKDTT